MTPAHFSTPTFLTCDAWGHCFVGSIETILRWAFDPEADTLVAQAQRSWGYEPLGAQANADLLCDLQDNGALVGTSGEDVETVSEWPEWAVDVEVW